MMCLHLLNHSRLLMLSRSHSDAESDALVDAESLALSDADSLNDVLALAESERLVLVDPQ